MSIKTVVTPALNGLIAFFVLLNVVLLVLYLNKHVPRQPSPASTPILQVGDETIYAADFEAQSLRYPPMPGQEAERDDIIRTMLIRDSIVLQAGAKDGFTTLDKTIFNSPQKELTKRKAAVRAVEEAVTQKSARITGELVSLWFMNIRPGPIGYAAGQALAYETILPLYRQVQRGAISMQEAGRRLQTNAALAQVDPSYQTNAYYAFDLPLKTDVVFDPDFDQALKSLPPGELSDLKLLQDHENGDTTQPKKDAVYLFGKVSARNPSSIDSFESWYESHKNTYPVSDR